MLGALQQSGSNPPGGDICRPLPHGPAGVSLLQYCCIAVLFCVLLFWIFHLSSSFQQAGLGTCSLFCCCLFCFLQVKKQPRAFYVKSETVALSKASRIAK